MAIQKNTGKQEAVVIIGCLIICSTFGYAVREYMSLPYVEVSVNTGECVQVRDAHGAVWVDGCKWIPEKYKEIPVP